MLRFFANHLPPDILPFCCWFACLLMFGKHDEIFLKYQMQGDRCGGCGLGTICRDLKRIDLPWPALTSQPETGSSTILATLCDSCDRSWEATNGIGASQAGQTWVVATMLQRQAAWHSLIVLTWEWTGRDMLRLNLESFGNIAGWHSGTCICAFRVSHWHQLPQLDTRKGCVFDLASSQEATTHVVCIRTATQPQETNFQIYQYLSLADQLHFKTWSVDRHRNYAASRLKSD